MPIAIESRSGKLLNVKQNLVAHGTQAVKSWGTWPPPPLYLKSDVCKHSLLIVEPLSIDNCQKRPFPRPGTTCGP